MFTTNAEKTIDVGESTYSDSIIQNALSRVYEVLSFNAKKETLPTDIITKSFSYRSNYAKIATNAIATIGKYGVYAEVKTRFDLSTRSLYDRNPSRMFNDAPYCYPSYMGALPYIPLDGLRSIVESSSAKPAKAIKKWLYDSYGVKIDADQLSKIGNVFSAHVSGKITLKLTLGCDGSAREYFHSGSCWWGEYAQSRDWLEYNGGGSIRAYRGNTLIGRVWFIPYDGQHGRGIILFNAYGNDQLAHVSTWGDLVSQAWASQSIGARFYPSTSQNAMYVNTSTSALVGTITTDSQIPSLHVDLKTPHDFVYGFPQYECACCGGMVDGDDLTYVEGEGDICEYCLERHYCYSEYANGYIHSNYAYYSDRMNDYLPDDDCIQINIIGYRGRWDTDYILTEDAIEIDGQWYAKDDRGETWDICAGCGDRYDVRNMEESLSGDGDSVLCDYCYEQAALESVDA